MRLCEGLSSLSRTLLTVDVLRAHKFSQVLTRATACLFSNNEDKLGSGAKSSTKFPKRLVSKAQLLTLHCTHATTPVLRVMGIHRFWLVA